MVMMMKRGLVCAVALLLSMPVHARAQEAAQTSVVSRTVKVQIVLTRFQGEKKISSLPYTLTVNMDDRNRNVGRSSLRLGTQVPITTMSRSGGDARSGEGTGQLVPTVQYRDVGTSIDCGVTALDDLRFKVDLQVEDSSVEATPSAGATASHPAFKSFRTSNTLLLRDGQSSQYSSATDRVNGEVWKVDVTLTVVK